LGVLLFNITTDDLEEGPGVWDADNISGRRTVRDEERREGGEDKDSYTEEEMNGKDPETSTPIATGSRRPLILQELKNRPPSQPE
jgi:hypothetical protein